MNFRHVFLVLDSDSINKSMCIEKKLFKFNRVVLAGGKVRDILKVCIIECFESFIFFFFLAHSLHDLKVK